MHFDIFNGDADGICALHQLRLVKPMEESCLITGVKRDISLLKQLSGTHPEEVTVCDISLDKNREPLIELLGQKIPVCYIDHHYAGEIPQCADLTCHIDASPETCTSLIVNNLLDGAFPLWAICGAFGDNLNDQALILANELGLSSQETEVLQEIGELFNYNGYGAEIADLHFAPDELYRAVQPFEDPFDFAKNSEAMEKLRAGYTRDMDLALNSEDISSQPPHRVYRFPNAPWARRSVGVFSNMKAREKKDAAHAVIMEKADKTLQISVRAPLTNRINADTLCRQFPTGGGRAAAAGINALPPKMLNDFLTAFYAIYSDAPPTVIPHHES